MNTARRISGLVLVFFILIVIAIQCKAYNPSVAIGKKYAIATDHPLASRAGIDILDQGGNVVDALVASSFAISVVRPQSTGIGGGGFALVRVGTSGISPRTIGYDFRERAPLLASSRMYQDSKGSIIPGKSMFGYTAVATPGMVKGLWEMHKNHGSLPWSKVLEPAIRLAEEGFPVYENLSQAIDGSLQEMTPAMKSIFTREDKPIQPGELLIQIDLANTLRKIQTTGDKDFYSGSIAEAIHEAMLAENAYLRKEDLQAYQVKLVNPIHTTYRGHKIESFPLPSSASFLFQILGVLEHYDLSNIYSQDPGLYSILLVEAMSAGFKDRSVYGGDSEYFSEIERSATSKLFSNETIESKKLEIENKITQIRYPSKKVDSLPSENSTIPKHLESYNTTHISVMDSDGNLASSTHSVNYIFGARVVVPGTGIILNDTMDDFSIKPGFGNAYGLVGATANSIQPGKTPLSSMSPTIVYKGEKPWFTLGAPGGSFIFTSILNTILRRIDFGEDSYASVSGARIHYQGKPDIVFLEDDWSQEGKKKLEEIYNVKVMESKAKVFITEIQPVNNKLIGVSDPRGQGRPLAR